MGKLKYYPPRILEDAFVLDEFSCAQPSLDDWLKKRARKNNKTGASRVYAVTCGPRNVVAYYSLSAGSVSHSISPGRIKRNMPEPIPIAVLGRLVVDSSHAGKGLGAGMLKDALLRSQRIAEQMGIRALLCHAIDNAAMEFYKYHGFIESPIEPRTMMMPLA
ncbi:GNAT family N-acetyltransferase [Spongiibacter sp. KMU-158]|uniref:GNAT family N-acetyltransferase n=1 Tax=Spongiibacter pelagi TaxID=2760804 RepID=A0A927GWY6_9GAMM|nr:GNAT family N-acetyltransferase [Spongiibacter pelagi]MBD2858889.1 GNAT family N-acetyltransferase [Spongiibacter pelagi]